MNSPFFGIYGASYRWSLGGKLALEEVSFEMSSGEILALLGPNGSGKSTLLKWAAGILPSVSKRSEGQVRFQGQNFLGLPPALRAQKVAYVGAELSIEFPMTAYELVLLGRTCWQVGFSPRRPEDDGRVRWAMGKCLCWGLKDRLVTTLSGGERQLIALARVLAQGARVLFLDESLSKMDLHHQEAMGKMLRTLAKEEATSVIWVSHDVNLSLAFADSALLLKTGKKVAQGRLADVISDENIQKLYPGSSLKVDRHSKVMYVGIGS